MVLKRKIWEGKLKTNERVLEKCLHDSSSYKLTSSADNKLTRKYLNNS